LRFIRRSGPHRIAYHLHLPCSTVETVFRPQCPLLARVDQKPGMVLIAEVLLVLLCAAAPFRDV
jgi:hypothetical protein